MRIVQLCGDLHGSVLLYELPDLFAYGTAERIDDPAAGLQIERCGSFAAVFGSGFDELEDFGGERCS